MSVDTHAQGDVRETARTGETRARKRLIVNVLLQVLAMIGIGVLVYANAANWFATLNHNSEISGYVSSVRELSDIERSEKLQAAYDYNDTLELGQLVDPYLEMNPDEAANSEAYQAYRELLRVTGTNAIGEITYPRLGIGLPIYHGTADEVISKGVGHMFGSSLPVGGPSTRSVLTAHSGLPHAKLFTALPSAKVGDQFSISVLGEQHWYEVRATETVLPNETENLQIVEGEDWVTLFTCTPIGINSHRFMVHAERIEPPASVDGRQVIAGDGLSAGFPWWAVWFIAGSGVVAWMLFAPPRKRRKQKPRATADPAIDPQAPQSAGG